MLVVPAQVFGHRPQREVTAFSASESSWRGPKRFMTEARSQRDHRDIELRISTTASSMSVMPSSLRAWPSSAEPSSERACSWCHGARNRWSRPRRRLVGSPVR